MLLVTVVARDPSYARHNSAMAAGIASIAFSGLAFVVVIARCFDRRLILVIDDRGIRDLRLGSNTIPWEDIQSISEYSVRRQVFFSLRVDDPMRYVERPVKRLMLNVNRMTGFPALNLSAHGLDISQEELRHALDESLSRKKAP